jgi:hypothetical protein
LKKTGSMAVARKPGALQHLTCLAQQTRLSQHRTNSANCRLHIPGYYPLSSGLSMSFHVVEPDARFVGLDESGPGSRQGGTRWRGISLRSAKRARGQASSPPSRRGALTTSAFVGLEGCGCSKHAGRMWATSPSDKLHITTSCDEAKDVCASAGPTPGQGLSGSSGVATERCAAASSEYYGIRHLDACIRSGALLERHKYHLAHLGAPTAGLGEKGPPRRRTGDPE